MLRRHATSVVLMPVTVVAVIAASAQVTLGDARLLLVPKGHDPYLTTARRDYEVTVGAGDTITVEVYLHGAYAPSNGYRVYMDCAFESVAGDPSTLIHLRDQSGIDYTHPQWFWADHPTYVPNVNWGGLRDGRCEDDVPCTTNDDCDIFAGSVGTCTSNGFCLPVPYFFSWGFVHGTDDAVIAPMAYLGEFVFQTPSGVTSTFEVNIGCEGDHDCGDWVNTYIDQNQTFDDGLIVHVEPGATPPPPPPPPAPDGPARMFLMPRGVDPADSVPGGPFEWTVTAGTTLDIDVYIENIPGKIESASVGMPCSHSSEAPGSPPITYVAGTADVNVSRDDYFLTVANAVGFHAIDVGQCEEMVPCSSSGDCSGSASCSGSTNVCQLSRPRTAVLAIIGQFAVDTSYVGQFSYDVPLDAIGEYSIGSDCQVNEEDCTIIGPVEHFIDYDFEGLRLNVEPPPVRRIFLTRHGQDAVATVQGQNATAEVVAGGTIKIDAWLENSFEPIRGVDVALECRQQSSDTMAGDLVAMPESVTVDEARADYVFGGMNRFVAIDQGAFVEEQACTIDDDCTATHTSSRCDGGFCRAVPMRSGNVLATDSVMVTEPKYLGSFEFFAPTNAGGIYTIEPYCTQPGGCSPPWAGDFAFTELLGEDGTLETESDGIDISVIPCSADVQCLKASVCEITRCNTGTCMDFAADYGDIIEPFSGVVQTSDILCAIDGFGVYANCPNADIFGCQVTGVPITTSDILAVVDAFGGADPCGCTGPSAASAVELIRGDGLAVISLVPHKRAVRPGGQVGVDIFVSNAPGIIGYEIRNDFATELADVAHVGVDEARRDYIFAGADAFAAMDQSLMRIGAITLSDPQPRSRSQYLGTVSLDVDEQARGTLTLTLDPDNIDLFRASNELIAVNRVNEAVVIVVAPANQ